MILWFRMVQVAQALAVSCAIPESEPLPDHAPDRPAFVAEPLSSGPLPIATPDSPLSH